MPEPARKLLRNSQSELLIPGSRVLIDYSEGVYGLVRAFRTAGAKNVLMTLSTVDDKPSMEFFTKFYEIWLSSKDNPTPAEALHLTRLYFIKKYHDKPETWSPYVMVGG